MKWHGFAGAAILVMGGCSSNPIHQKSDVFYEGGIFYTDPVSLSHARYDVDRGGAYMTVAFERVQGKDAAPQFDMKIRAGIRSGELLDVSEGETLSIVVDGHRTLYSTPGGSAAGRPAPGMRKPEDPYILYDQIPPDDLRAIANAKSVEFEIKGSIHSVTAEFNSSCFEKLKLFVDSQVPKVIP